MRSLGRPQADDPLGSAPRDALHQPSRRWSTPRPLSSRAVVIGDAEIGSDFVHLALGQRVTDEFIEEGFLFFGGQFGVFS